MGGGGGGEFRRENLVLMVMWSKMFDHDQCKNPNFSVYMAKIVNLKPQVVVCFLSICFCVFASNFLFY